MLRRLSPLTWDFITLYGLQFSNFFIPLLTFPILARTLMPDSWTALLAAQALGVTVATVVEYGHNITATRRIASITDGAQVARTVRLVYASKGLLVGIILILCWVIYYIGWNIDHTNVLLLALGVVFGILQGSLPTWYFQGRHQIRTSAGIDMCFKVLTGLAMVVIAAVLRSPEAVLTVQVIGISVTWVILTTLLYSNIKFVWGQDISLIDIYFDLKLGFSGFVFRLLGNSYTSALALVLSIVVSPLSGALILAADRIAKAMPTLTVPFCQMLYPRVISSNMFKTFDGLRNILMYAVTAFIILLSSSFLLYLFRKPIVLLLLGPVYIDAIDILSITVWITPFIGFNTILFNLWIFPVRQDNLANMLLALNAICSLVWMFLMASKTSLALYSGGILITEILVSLILVCLISRSLKNSRQFKFINV